MAPGKGRFHESLHPEALRFSSSLSVDARLYREDIEGSLAHAAMLAQQGIISARDAGRIRKALREIGREIDRGSFKPGKLRGNVDRFVADDIHMAIEHRLVQKLGDTGGRLHTARSRNDQVALDERLYLRRAVGTMQKSIRRLQRAIVATAGKNRSVVMPGYTHLQRAQPILLAHHLLAHVSMIDRDFERFTDCLGRVTRSPLGAGALAGTSFPIDRANAARMLGFSSIIENSIDAVSDRDVQIEFLSACAITMMHLSRFAEEIILWNSEEWGFVRIGDAFATGSSIMPQKKNPDIAELVRGKTGRVYGDLVALLTVMKGLPLSYNRDMQEDKEPLFDAADTVADCLSMFTLMVGSLKFNPKRFSEDGQTDYLLATELADYLVRKGLPFRRAHSIVGNIVRHCVDSHLSLKELPLRQYQRYSGLFGKDIWEILDVRASLRKKKSVGSTSPREVDRNLKVWGKKTRVG